VNEANAKLLPQGTRPFKLTIIEIVNQTENTMAISHPPGMLPSKVVPDIRPNPWRLPKADKY
jgi:hypothetical protein